MFIMLACAPVRAPSYRRRVGEATETAALPLTLALSMAIAVTMIFSPHSRRSEGRVCRVPGSGRDTDQCMSKAA